MQLFSPSVGFYWYVCNFFHERLEKGENGSALGYLTKRSNMYIIPFFVA
jgi:hypothetical protein